MAIIKLRYSLRTVFLLLLIIAASFNLGLRLGQRTLDSLRDESMRTRKDLDAAKARLAFIGADGERSRKRMATVLRTFKDNLERFRSDVEKERRHAPNASKREHFEEYLREIDQSTIVIRESEEELQRKAALFESLRD